MAEEHLKVWQKSYRFEGFPEEARNYRDDAFASCHCIAGLKCCDRSPGAAARVILEPLRPSPDLLFRLREHFASTGRAVLGTFASALRQELSGHAPLERGEARDVRGPLP